MPMLVMSCGLAILVVAFGVLASAYEKERRLNDDLHVAVETHRARAVTAEAVAAKDRRLSTMLGKALAEEQDDHAQTAGTLVETERRLGRIYTHVALVHGPDFARAICEAEEKPRASA